MAARLAVVTARLLGRALSFGRPAATTTPARRLASRGASPTLRPDLLLAGHEPKPPSRSPSGARAPAIVWFRADLRTRDHAPLRAALASARVTSVLPVFVFDPREYPSPAPGGSSGSGSGSGNNVNSTVPTAGPRRASLVLGAVRELRARLRALGSDLLVRVGPPEEVLPRLAAASGASRVYCHREGGAHDTSVERAVASALRNRAGGCELRTGTGGAGGGGGGGGGGWGAAGALLHPSDLPAALRPPATAAAVSQPPPTTAFGDFCQRVTGVRVREPLAAPLRLKGLPTPLAAVAGAGAAATTAATTLDAGPIPSMRELGFAEDVGVSRVSGSGGGGGGETEALRQLRAFAQELKRSQQRQGGATRSSPSSSSSSPAADHTAAATAFVARVSPWLAVGCLSPREVFAELSAKDQASKTSKGAVIAPPAARTQQQQQQQGQTEGQDRERAWLASELLLRDFFGLLNAWRNSSPGPVAAKTAAAGAVSAAAAAPPQLAFA